jgi:hypothetical protein
MDQKAFIGGIRTSNGTLYKIRTRQGIACMFLEREEQETAGVESDSNLKEKKQLN